ncbi:hypothetical protein PAALTS15_08074 [Paenibacillus alvei TS-15]|uniref:Uncharacterized protein n=1 Tax=Paenibacillus alvei TS-15 TaxID=1117108 RepID=S9TZZ0_PAEAL|nr:hypothetical protein PAALTS15_08074 [Paenibacillus alvei TS-15]
MKTAGYKTMPASSRAVIKVFQPSIQRIYQPNIQLISSHVPDRLPEIRQVIMLSYRKRKDSENRQRMFTGNIPQIGRPPECRHASNSSIDGKPFPMFLLYSHLFGKIFKFD